MTAAVLVISSFVVRGAVGSRAAFVLERLGHRVWCVPTIILPWHPGHGLATKIVPPRDEFAALCADLARAPWLDEVGAVISGYLGDPSQAEAIAGLVQAVKARNPDALYLCDPVIGDAEGLYVSPETAAVQRDVLLPLADLATPNRYELAWLTRTDTEEMGSLVQAARSLHLPRVVVTSAPAMMRGRIGTALVTADDVLIAENVMVGGGRSGTGDVFAAMFVSGLLTGKSDEAALSTAAAGTFEIVARTTKSGTDEFHLPAEQASIARPMAEVSVRRFATARRPAGKAE